ncbi:hypothetical protein [Luteimonas wenzhouensis]|uniref:hypothetical protein n=1 Tax=Luteimonas wenzhouensis TaxID=2599615 RepID=UPI001646315C|nr:hypothetical protein [Luteimonas wenzhouensis]
MPITRAQATQLLNQGEMALYDDSRINGLRQLDARALGARIRRARTARDRARDLVQKHALASRARTGSKRGDSGLANRRSRDKAELLADILRRFEQRLKQVERADASAEKAGAGATGKTAGKASTGRGRKSAAKAATKTAATKKATTKKTATRKSTAKKAAAGKSTTARAATKNAAASAKRSTTRKSATGWAAASTSSTRKATTRKSAAKTAATSAAKKRGAKTASKTPAMNGTATRGKPVRKGHITPEQALAQTHALLEAKQAQDAAPRPWQALANGAAPAVGQPGYQSDEAARRAQDLHAAESRIPAIQGSASTRDRIQQGKRDHRGDGD